MAGSLGDMSLIWDDKKILLEGLKVAFEVSVVALAISVVLGLAIALMRMSKPPFTWIAWLYINIFRGLPALVTALWIFFGVSVATGINFSTFQAAVITLTLLYSAYNAEIFRSALQAVPPGHKEAGHALGMRSSRVFFSVTLPQATKIALPNVGSMFIGMVKDTSTFTLIGLVEVVRTTQNVVSINFQYFPLYTAAAILYILAAFAIDLVFRTVESGFAIPPRGWLSKALRRRKGKRIARVVQQLAVT